VTADDAVEPGPVIGLDPLELRAVRLDDVLDAPAADEHLLRVDTASGRMNTAVRCARIPRPARRRTQDACGLGPSIDEDDNLLDLRVVAAAQ